MATTSVGLTETGTPITALSPRDAKGKVIEPRPSTPPPDQATHRVAYRHYILVDAAGRVVGHADDLNAAQPMADDVALGLYSQDVAPTPTTPPVGTKAKVVPALGGGDLTRPELAADHLPRYVGLGVTIYARVSFHAPRAFTAAELAETTPEGATVVAVKRERAKLVVAAAEKDVRGDLTVTLDHLPNRETSDAIAEAAEGRKGSKVVAADVNTTAARDKREAALNAKSAEQVRALAVKAGVEGATKADNIAAILAQEF